MRVRSDEFANKAEEKALFAETQKGHDRWSNIALIQSLTYSILALVHIIKEKSE